MRHLDEIIVHCTATPATWRQGQTTSAKVAEVRRWHVDERGWSDIGYHYLIDRDGTVVEGRPLARPGAHVRGHNRNSIGIALFGGHGSAETDAFADNFTPAQDAALRRLLDSLRDQHKTISKVTGHNEYAAKACPGFSVSEWLRNAPAKPPTHPRAPAASPAPAQRSTGGIAGLFRRILAALKGDA
jgi:N-acetyl-anhydromuramyl-L-alanine amidase AmpD